MRSHRDELDHSEAARRPAMPPFWWPRVAAAALWTLVAGVLVVGLIGVAAPRGGHSVADTSSPRPVRWDVANVATASVISQLRATSNESPPAADEPPLVEDLFGLGADVSTASVVEVSADRWRVTLTVNTPPVADSDEEVGGPLWFEVEVVETSSGLAADGLPWVVAPPPVGVFDGGWGDGVVPDASSLADDTVARFLSALLTGNGELDRYASAGSGLRAAPAVFESVSVERIASRRVDEGREVRAWVIAEADGWSLELMYDLVLVERAGRWEVAAIGHSPVVHGSESGADGAVDASSEES